MDKRILKVKKKKEGKKGTLPSIYLHPKHHPRFLLQILIISKDYHPIHLPFPTQSCLCVYVGGDFPL